MILWVLAAVEELSIILLDVKVAVGEGDKVLPVAPVVVVMGLAWFIKGVPWGLFI